jgi:putative phosphoesterase
MGESTIIAHISDLHCGSRYHIPSLAKRVIDELNELEPDIVMVTGDLTDMGFRQEFSQAKRLLADIRCEKVLVLLGNHDARNVGDEHFADLFGSRSVELCHRGVHVLGLDSSEPDLDSGRIGRDRYRWIEERFAAETDEFNVVAMHHHLVPVPGTGRERNIVHDAGDLLKVLATNSVDLVLCGHKHVPNVWRLEDMLIVNAGTCCTHRLRGKVRPCYNIIEIDGGEVRVLLKEPYVDAVVVADFHDVNRRYCRWRAGTAPEGDAQPLEA